MKERGQAIYGYAEAGVVVLYLAQEGVAGAMQGSPHRPRSMVVI